MKYFFHLRHIVIPTICMVIAVVMGVDFFDIQPVYAASCTVSTTSTIDQTYIDTNSCSSITITGTITVTWSGTTDLQGDGTVTVQGGGTVTFSGATVLGSTDDMTITGSTTITQAASNTTGVSITARNLTIDSGSKIDVSNKGCSGGVNTNENGYGPNTGTGVCALTTSGYGDGSTTGGGAGHGGAGGKGSDNIAGATYDTTTGPTLLGAGGGAGNSNDGGYGGGNIQITLTGTLTVSGSILSNGQNGNSTSNGFYGSGGGAGGSIYITTIGLSGAGSLSANGGSGGTGSSGAGAGGGGGILAVYYTTDTSSLLTGWTVTGGATGGAGSTAGSDGSTYSFQYTVPSTPSISSPVSGIYNSSRNLGVTSSAYSSNGKSHTHTDWKVTTDSGGNTTVWSDTADATNLTSVTVNTTNGSFSGALSGATQLAANTTYYLFVRYKNAVGYSSWSSGVSFTTIGSNLTTQTWSFDDSTQYTNNSTYVSVNSSGNSLAQLVDQGGGTYYTGSSLVGWTRRKAITVNSPGTALTNYQIRMSVTYDTDMNSDFSDIRFTSSDGSTLIDHWMESSTASSSAVFWVEVPSIPSSGSTTVYMYYGNSGASSVSSAANAFVFGDDFSGATISNSWTEISTGGASAGTIASGQWTKTCNGSCDWWTGDNLDAGIYTANPSGTWEAITKLVSATSSGSKHVGIMLYNSLTSGYLWGLYPSSTQYRTEKIGTANLCTISNTTQPSWLKVQKSTNNGAGQNETYKFYQSTDGSTWTQCGTYSTSDIMGYVGLFVKDWDSTSTSGTFDSFYIKKYNSTEPTTSIGSEEITLNYGNVSVSPAAGGSHPTYATLGTFTETLGSGSAGSVYYQISRDGTSWYYETGGTWTAVAVNETDYNTASQVNAYLPAFASQVGTGSLYFKAFLVSNGSQLVKLDSIAMTYNATPTTSTLPDQTLNEDQSATGKFDLDSYFLDPGDTLTYSVVNDFSASLGTMTVNSNGTVDFALAANVNGSDTISFRATDANGLTVDSNSVTITVTAVNDAPSFTKGSNQTIHQDAGAQTVSSWATSMSAGPSDESSQTLSFTLTNNNNGLFSVQPAVSSLGVLTYTPLSTATGSATVTVTLGDNGGTANSGVDSSSQTFTITVTNTAPVVGSLTASQKTNGTDVVDFAFQVSDADLENQVQVKVEVNVGTGWTPAILSTVDANTTATFGDPKIDNTASYQVGTSAGFILTASGANTVQVQWPVVNNFTNVDSSTVQFRVTANDGGTDSSVTTSSNFVVDTLVPTTPGSFTKASGSGTTAVFTWTTTTETNFANYQIWYGTNQSTVASKSSTKWDHANDTLLSTRTTTTTTVTGLTPGSSYYVMICGVDGYGNAGCSSTISFVTNQTPTVSTVTAAERTNASGDVTISFIMDDPDNDDTLQALIEYNNGSGWQKATLSEASGNRRATYGAPTVVNANTYQVGSASGYITSSPGANTVQVVWSSKADVPTADLSNAQIRVTPYDGIAAGVAGTSSSFVLDNVIPSTLSDLSLVNQNGILTVSWSPVTSENNFDHYEIWYGTDVAKVLNRDNTTTEYDQTDDATLGTQTTATVTIAGLRLSAGTAYTVALWAIDDFGNESAVVNATLITGGVSTTDNTVSQVQYGGGSSSGSGSRSTTSNTSAQTNVTETQTGTAVETGTGITTGTTVSETSSVDLNDVAETIATTISSDLSWSATSLKGLINIDAIQSQENLFTNLQDLLLGFLFEPQKEMTRIDVLELSLHVFYSDYISPNISFRGFTFTDVANDSPYGYYLNLGKTLDIITGYDDGTFRPDQKVNRAEALKMLLTTARMDFDIDSSIDILAQFGLAENPFSDVSLSAWYAPYVLYAYSKGIVHGYGDGTFRPENTVIRAEFAKMITATNDLVR